MALTALSPFAGRWFVVKIGGELLSDPRRLSDRIGSAIRAFCGAGIKVAVIHGAGPQATELMQRLGLNPVVIGGRRVTDKETLEVMKMALAGQASVDVAAALHCAGVPALATTGVSAGLVQARRRPPVVVSGGGPEPIDFGWVGDVSGVNVELFEQLARLHLVVVLASLAGDGQGNVYNINADTVAARVAGRLAAAKLVLVSDVPGVLRDPGDPTSRIPRLTRQEARSRIAAGSIRGGMIPKVEESLRTLDEGIESVHLVGIEPADALIEEVGAPGSRGTVLER